MHRLHRPEQEPPELRDARRRHPANWDGFRDGKAAVKEALLRMQDNLCAYCEKRLPAKGDPGQIEHFRKKDAAFFPELMFAWDNLFCGCQTAQTCGTHKETLGMAREDYDLLIDPARENPERFLVFTETGRVSPRSGLAAAELRRAEFTIKAFNLNEPSLVQKRHDLLAGYGYLKSLPIDQLREHLTSAVERCGYMTALHHFLGLKVDAEE